MTELATMEFHPRPQAGEAKPWAFPAPERGTLDNGLTVLRCHRPGQQIVAVEVLLDAPLDAEPAGLDGVATIMARAFSEGTDRLSAEEYAAELERAGATLDTHADHPGVRLSLEVPASRLVADYYGTYEDTFDMQVLRPAPVRRVDPGSPLTVTLIDDRVFTADLVLNATPVLDETLVELGGVRQVVDLGYRPAGGDTALVAAARVEGCERVVDGLDVLVAQGALSFERWTWLPAPKEAMERAVRSLRA